VNNNDIELETPLHLFFMCEPIEELLSVFYRWFTNNVDFTFTRQEYFTVFDRNDFSVDENEVLTIVTKLVMKFIWDCKQRFCLPNINHLKTSIKLELESIGSVNKTLHGKLRGGGFEHIYNDIR
jgi:hypothetical protein